MEKAVIRKTSLRESNEDEDLKGKSPEQLIGMMWQLALSPGHSRKIAMPTPDFKDMLSCLNDERVECLKRPNHDYA